MRERGLGRVGTFSGTASFTPTDDGGLAYREEGSMSWGGHTGPAFREYLLRPTDNPAVMDMTFPDGRPFHRMGFTASEDSDRHWCDPDTYVVHYHWAGEDEFSYVWDVRGPAKDLVLETRLRRTVA